MTLLLLVCGFNVILLLKFVLSYVLLFSRLMRLVVGGW